MSIGDLNFPDTDINTISNNKV